jgi:hypothetical protein
MHSSSASATYVPGAQGFPSTSQSQPGPSGMRGKDLFYFLFNATWVGTRFIFFIYFFSIPNRFVVQDLQVYLKLKI